MKIQVCTFFAVYLLFALMIIFNILNTTYYLIEGEPLKSQKAKK